MREGAVQIVDDVVDEPDRGSRPPGWMIVAVVVVGIAVASFVVSQASTSSDSTADASVSSNAGYASPIEGRRLTAVTARTPSHLRGKVAVASPDVQPLEDRVWVLRPGGSVVGRADHFIGGAALMTVGSVMTGLWIFDDDLVDRPTMLGSNRELIAGAEPGLVWFARTQNLRGRETRIGDYLWVAPVDVESRTVGERADITGLISRPVAGVADGLIVVPVDDETYGRFAYWSPTDGLVSLNLRDPGSDIVVAASGNLVVVATAGRVSVLDIASGDYLSSFSFNSGGTVTSACLSPDRRRVIVVGSNGEAVVGNTTTGEISVIDGTNVDYDELWPNITSIQQTHGIGWTADDQVVFIGGGEDRKHLFGFDIATGEIFKIADLDGAGEWWLAASGSMC
jgi:hypothetical protein